MRTYVRDESGRDGVWFLSLDVPGPVNMFGGRLLGVPYYLAVTSLEVAEGLIRYRCRLRPSGGAMLSLDVSPDPPGPVSRAGVATSLAGRWRAFTRVGRLLEVPLEHEPWVLQPARVNSLDETLLEATGVVRPPVEPVVAWADCAHARLGYPRRPRLGGGP